jgi:ligand-binding SRPBCC domain-containing protein
VNARRRIELSFESHLAAPAAEVWVVASTMPGVNAELRPLMSMTHPAGLGSLDDRTVVTGQVLFRSWLLLGGIVPIDRHHLRIERMIAGVGFDEESSSWLQRRWRHERRVIDAQDGSGCVVTDRLLVEPRFEFTAPIVDVAVRRIFRHRHRRLLARFGAGAQ